MSIDYEHGREEGLAEAATELSALRAELAAAKGREERLAARVEELEHFAAYPAAEVWRERAEAAEAHKKRLLRFLAGVDQWDENMRCADMPGLPDHLRERRAALTEEPKPRPRGVAGDRCESGNECGRLGCEECQS